MKERYVLGVLAWRSVIATKVGRGVAPKTSLRLAFFGHAVGSVASEHAESLGVHTHVRPARELK
jgi:hypothetical protein